MAFSQLNIYPSPTRDLSIVYTVGLINSLGVHGCIVEPNSLECGCMVMCHAEEHRSQYPVNTKDVLGVDEGERALPGFLQRLKTCLSSKII